MHNCYYSFDFCFCSCAVGHLESSPAQQLLGKLYDELWTWPTFFLSCIPSPGPCNVILYLFSLRSDTIFYPWIRIGLLTFFGQWDISKNDRNQGLKKKHLYTGDYLFVALKTFHHHVNKSRQICLRKKEHME